MFKKILIANDGSEGARKALKTAIDLAIKYSAELHSISVEEGVPHYAATIGEVEDGTGRKRTAFSGTLMTRRQKRLKKPVSPSM